MAKTVVNLSDQISTWVTKTNTISDDLGDISALTSGDSNVVDAINAILADPGIDSVGILALFSVNNTNGGAITLSYDSSSGSIGISNSLKSSATINYDSAAANFSLASNIPVTTFTNIGTLNILDSDGTTLHTLYKAT